MRGGKRLPPGGWLESLACCTWALNAIGGRLGFVRRCLKSQAISPYQTGHRTSSCNLNRTHAADRFFETDVRPLKGNSAIWTVIAERSWLKPQLFYNFFVLKIFLIVDVNFVSLESLIEFSVSFSDKELSDDPVSLD